MKVYHGSKDKLTSVSLSTCHLGWHAGTLCQAIDIAEPKRIENKYDWDSIYLYVCDIFPDETNCIKIPDVFRYDSDFESDIIKALKTSCTVQKKNPMLISALDNCVTAQDIRQTLLRYDIKYIQYENSFESKGMSYCILEHIKVQRYTFLDYLNKL